MENDDQPIFFCQSASLASAHYKNQSLMKLSSPRHILLIALITLAGCAPSEKDVALGTLERDRIVLPATAAEIVVARPIAEGSAVEVGDLLVQLDARQQQLVVNAVEAEVAQLEAALTQLRNGPRAEEIAAAEARVESNRAVLHENRLRLERIKDLVEKKVASQADLDNITALVESNAARLREAEAQLDLLRAGTRTEEIAQAQARLEAGRARLAMEQKKLNDLSITATRAGILDALPFELGERTAVGAPAAVILSSGAPYARVYIPETSRAAIAIGTVLEVRLDGSEKSYQGRVRWIAKDPAFTPYFALNSSERSRLVYLAEVQLPAEADHLPTGLPAQVRLPK